MWGAYATPRHRVTAATEAAHTHTKNTQSKLFPSNICSCLWSLCHPGYFREVSKRSTPFTFAVQYLLCGTVVAGSVVSLGSNKRPGQVNEANCNLQLCPDIAAMVEHDALCDVVIAFSSFEKGIAREGQLRRQHDHIKQQFPVAGSPLLFISSSQSEIHLRCVETLLHYTSNPLPNRSLFRSMARMKCTARLLL